MPFRRPRRRSGDRPVSRPLALVVALIAVSAIAPATGQAAPPPDPGAAVDHGHPTVHYEQAMEHADDVIDFEPGGRVTVGFRPRPGDRSEIGGAPPRALPAGRLSGRDLRPELGPDPVDAPAPAEEPEVAAPTSDPTPEATSEPATEPSPEATPIIDGPIVDPSDVIDAEPASYVAPVGPATSDLAAQVSPDGLRKEIFGYLPYWEVSDSSTTLDYTKLSTIAYFGVGAAADGSLEKTSSGSSTVGWSGWTSSRMTTVINDAHRNGTRVVLTIQSFGWSTTGLNKQKALLGSSSARTNLANQIVAAVRDRGADGVNLDFEPLASGYDEEFTALVRLIRTKFDAVAKGYQITFATTGYIGNYPIEAATAPGGADAIFIMGYDYRNGSTNTVGSIAPIGGPTYDITDTILAYTARVPASKVILGVPYYGRAWSTDTDQFNARNISGTQYGASATVVYSNALPYLSEHGRRYNATEGVAWTVYRRQNCTSTYGCVNPWRQLYVDDAEAIRAKYDLVNRYGLRGAGIWALGYDHGRTELWNAIAAKFINDSSAPVAGITTLHTSQSTERFTVAWSGWDDVGIVSYDIDVSTNGGPWARWLTETTATSAPYVGSRGLPVAFRVRARDAKGKVSSTTGTPVWTGKATSIEIGGFGRVESASLNARTAASTGAAITDTLADGDRVRFLEGPVSSDGYSWYRVQAPLTSWPSVGGSRSDLWVAVSGSGVTNVVPTIAPSVTVVLSAATLASEDGARWRSITPTRVLDTRSGNGLSGSFVSSTVRTFDIAGRGGIPSDAIAVTANLTVTGSTSSGHVSLGPTMSVNPSTSSINIAKGGTLANGLTLRLASDGSVGAVFKGTVGARAHVILDVTGYYQVGDTGATWSPLSPARLLDTRSGNGLTGAFAAGSVRTLDVAGRGGIPNDAIAITGNLTATGATAAGYASVGPTMTSSPSTSTINIGNGTTLANNVTVRLSSGGSLGMVYMASAGARAHLLLDVTGYYRDGGGGAEWHPLTPVRLLDTRVPNGLAGASVDEVVRSFQLTGRGTIPVAATAVTANLTVTGANASGFVSIGATMSSTPTTSTINFAKGQTLANGLVLRTTSAGMVATVYAGPSGASVHQILDITGYFR